MSEQLIELSTAENDLLACAAYLAERIGSSDGHSESMKELIPRYLAKSDVDLAAELADAIDDPFVRDQMLTLVADRCSELNDDEYAEQLVEAIEEKNLQDTAREMIAIQKARQGKFAEAFEIADSLPHASYAYAEIAIRQEKETALQTVEKIEFPYLKVQALEALATQTDDFTLLDIALENAHKIEFDEERIRAYLGIAAKFIEGKRKDRAIEVLDRARQSTETIESSHQESFFSQISQGFVRAGSVDLGDRTLDLVKDKYEIAHALVAYADEFNASGETAEAIETLDEAYAILKSQRDRETRNTKSKFTLFGTMADRYADFGKFERAIEVANENTYEEIRNEALGNVARKSVLAGRDSEAQEAVALINDDVQKGLTLVTLCDAKRKVEDPEGAAEYLSEARRIGTAVEQPSMKSVILSQSARRYKIAGDAETARELFSESLFACEGILDSSNRVSSFAALADVLSELEFELNDSEKQMLRTMLLKSDR